MQERHTAVLTGVSVGGCICILICLLSCSPSRENTVGGQIYPEAAFDRLCSAFQREDYEAIYGSFSSESRKKLAESRKRIRNASDYRAFISPNMDALKRKAAGANVVVTLKMEDYAQGIALWGDDSEQNIWFKREGGIWKIDLAFDEEATTAPGGPETAPAQP